MSRLRVRLVPVEVHLCPEPDCELDTKRHAYEGSRCPSCRPEAPPNPVRTKAQDRLVVMGEHGVYKREARMKCAHEVEQDDGTRVRCDNLYAARSCPICGGEPAKGKRPTLVWVQTYPGGDLKVDLDVESLPGVARDDGISKVLEGDNPAGDGE